MTADHAPVSPDRARSLIAAEISALHRKRGEIWLQRRLDAYLSFYWDDAILFVVGARMTLPDFRRALVALLEAGGGPLAIDLPPVKDIAISSEGDAATTGFEWRTRSRSADGIDNDESYYETDVWYRRNGTWKIISIHLTRLSLSAVSTS